MTLVRITTLALVLSVAGLSSSLALCVSSCPDATPAESHACHELGAGLGMASDAGPCAHNPSLGPVIDLARDDRAPTAALPAMHALPRRGLHQTSSTRAAALIFPAPPVASPPILRI